MITGMGSEGALPIRPAFLFRQCYSGVASVSRKDRRRHAIHWPNAIRDYARRIELRVPDAMAPSTKKPRVGLSTAPGSSASLPDRVCLGPDQPLGRAARRYQLAVTRTISHTQALERYEFIHQVTRGLVFSYHPLTKDCRFFVVGSGQPTLVSVPARNAFHALRIAVHRSDIVVRGNQQRRNRSPKLRPLKTSGSSSKTALNRENSNRRCPPTPVE